MILRSGVFRFSRWEILGSGGRLGLLWGLVIAQSIGQLLRQTVAVHAVPRFRRHTFAHLFENANGHQLTTGRLLLLGAHPGLGFPAVMGALLFFPEPTIAALGSGRVAQEQRLAQKDGALHRDARELGEYRLIGHGATQQGREHGGGNLTHATPPAL
ncbi:hypothetical protein QWY79_10345 [Halomonas sabkhae]|nr:hypothetical protein [Halomonas sabkhae]MDN3525662.1 hypothetical protein [Halomonas sabkhae]